MKSRNGELLCIHKGDGTPQFAYGLCHVCYKEVNSRPMMYHFDFTTIYLSVLVIVSAVHGTFWGP